MAEETTERTIVKTLTVVYLPSRLGDAEVPSFVVRVGDQTVKTEPVAIRALAPV